MTILPGRYRCTSPARMSTSDLPEPESSSRATVIYQTGPTTYLPTFLGPLDPYPCLEPTTNDPTAYFDADENGYATPPPTIKRTSIGLPETGTLAGPRCHTIDDISLRSKGVGKIVEGNGIDRDYSLPLPATAVETATNGADPIRRTRPPFDPHRMPLAAGSAQAGDDTGADHNPAFDDRLRKFNADAKTAVHCLGELQAAASSVAHAVSGLSSSFRDDEGTVCLLNKQALALEQQVSGVGVALCQLLLSWNSTLGRAQIPDDTESRSYTTIPRASTVDVTRRPGS